VREFLPLVYNWVRIAVPASAVDDLVQETFCSLQISIGQLRDDASFRAFLYRLARRRIADFHRRRKLEGESVPIADVISGESVPDTASGVSDREAVEFLLAPLSDVERQIVTMRFLDECSVSTIAQTLRMSYEATRSRLRRALRKVEPRAKQLAERKK